MRAATAIQVDLERQRLLVEASGFFDRDLLCEFLIAYQAGEQKIARAGPFDILLDLTTYQPQARDVVDDLVALAATSKFVARRIAAVAPSMIVQLQLKRILMQTNSVTFTDRAAAEAWLDAGLDAPPPRQRVA